jgi:serine/threonine protein kinase
MMVFENRLLQDATKNKCRSIKSRNDLWERAVRKDGESKNGADKNLLFPRALIEAVLTREEMVRILGCQCSLCIKQAPEPMFNANLPHHIMQAWNKRRAFAILVYMGTTFATRLFFTRGLGTDGFNLADALRTLSLPRNTNTKDYFNNFTKVFESTKFLFEPPVFQKQNVWSKFTDDHNLPFLFEKPIQKGLPSSFGTLYSFWLHKDFCVDIPSIDIPFLSEGQTVDADKEFPQSKLARKELVGSEDAFNSERSILEFIAKEDHPHIIKLYFWYQRGHYFNLVFPYYPASLQQVLVEGWLPKRQPAIPERFKASKLRHWLWEQILNVIEGLERVHNPKTPQGSWPDIQGNLIGGHFDIKPANILIDHNGQLVLADFGQAQIKRSSGGTAFTGPGGTLAYQPPPPENSNDREAQQHWHRSYDVWSMACVMLETIHFILWGKERVKTFIADRETEEPPNTRSPAFWTQTPAGPVLKQCVQASLTQLKSENDRYLTMVAKLLQRMFTIDAKPRGNIMECLEELSKDNLTDQWPWKDEDEISIGGDHTNKSLKNLCVFSRPGNLSWNSSTSMLHIANVSVTGLLVLTTHPQTRVTNRLNAHYMSFATFRLTIGLSTGPWGEAKRRHLASWAII